MAGGASRLRRRWRDDAAERRACELSQGPGCKGREFQLAIKFYPTTCTLESEGAATSTRRAACAIPTPKDLLKDHL